MRACLVIPYVESSKYSIHVVVAAVEAAGIGVDIYLPEVSEFNEVIDFALRKYDRVVVGLSLMTTQLPNLLPFINSLRRFKGRAVLIGGGPHVSGDPVGSLKSLGFDYVFVGESEGSVTEFLRKLVEGGDPLSTKGIMYLEGGEVVYTGKPELVDLNKYPPISVKYGLFNPVEISRGCPFKCKYCQVGYVFGPVMRHRSVSEVVRYCMEMVRRGIKDLRFISPNSLAYGGRGREPNLNSLAELIEGLQELRRLGGRVYFGSFPSEVRPEFISEEVIKLIKGSVDNRRVVIGAQSGSERVLKDLGRGHTVDDVINAVKLLTEHGFGVDVDFIFGLPNEDISDMLETVGLIRKLTSLGARIHAHTFIPLPGTPYSKFRPKPIPDLVRAELNKYLGRGLLFGEWVRQRELALAIWRLREEGIILS